MIWLAVALAALLVLCAAGVTAAAFLPDTHHPRTEAAVPLPTLASYITRSERRDGRSRGRPFRFRPPSATVVTTKKKGGTRC
jgi:hypothetical protein